MAKAETLTLRNIGGLNIGTADEGNPFTNLLIYGEPGVGKTVLGASASAVPEMCPMLIVDVEGGTLSLRKLYPGVDVVRIRNFEEFNGLFADLKKGVGGYKTVMLDSLTEIQKLGMYDIMKRAVIKGEEKGEERDPDLPGIGEWGKNIEQTRKIIRAFRDLPCNTIFTALSMQESTRGGEVKRSKPSLSGKLASEVAGFLDVVVFMYLKDMAEKKDDESDIHRMLLTVNTGEIIAKDRTDNLPPVMVDPTMEQIHTLMHASITTKETANV